jgi:hypothetical protein
MQHRPYPVGVEIDARSQSWLSLLISNGYVLVFSRRRPSCNGCSTRVENYCRDARSHESFVSKGVASPEQSGLHSVRSATTKLWQTSHQTTVVEDSDFDRLPLSGRRRLLKDRTYRLLGGIKPSDDRKTDGQRLFEPDGARYGVLVVLEILQSL